MIALVRGDDKKRVALIDAIVGETREEFTECSIVGFQCGHVTSFARAIGFVCSMVVMHVGEVRIGDRYAVFLHGCHIGKRNRGRHTIEAGEALIALRILDDVAVQIGHRTVRADLWRDILIAEQSLVAAIAAGFIR